MAEVRNPSGEEWRQLDEAYASYLDAHPSPPGGSLLAQTILTSVARRELYAMLELRPGSDVLDLGTGFGPVALEIAHLCPVRAVGVDTDRDVLAVAALVADSLGEWVAPGGSARFERADVTALPVETSSVDLVTARLLFQHLTAPREVVDEIRRVLRPGGRAFVFDVDDGFSLSFPAPSEDLACLEQAFAACQSDRGGDRAVGRKLSTYFGEAGFTIEAVRPIAQAQHLASEQGDASRRVTAARLGHVRDEIVARGLLGAEEFDRRLAAFATEPSVQRFRAECQLAVVALRPLA